MFTDFLYLLRAYGMKTSLNEWNSLMDALMLNLNEASLMEFYQMARAILVKKVSDYDKFDQAFLDYFKGASAERVLPPELFEWLSKTMAQTPYNKEEVDSVWGKMSLEEIERLMRQRLAEQHEAHYGGNKWVGSGGTTAFGHSGYAPKGIRIEGQGMGKSALKVAAERNYKDFRDDKVLQVRQFQVALRKLRLLSTREEGAKTELDVDRTIEETCKQGGQLKLVMDHPRKNQTKLLLLMDSGGSMWAYADLCSRLFRAVNEANQFKDLKIYYFHNCIYENLFTSPGCGWSSRISSEWVLQNLKPEYKVILVGDASMGPSELLSAGGCIDYYHVNEKPGIYWLETFKKRFPASIWLNPLHEKLWDYDYSSRTIRIVREIFPMYQLTVRGLEDGIRELMKIG